MAVSMTRDQAASRAARIVELRTDRRSFREIAQLVNLSPTRCHQIYTAECDRLPAQALAEHRREALEMIDRADRDLITLAEDPQVSARMRAECWSAIRAWEERRAPLLGLDRPARREVTVITAEAVDAEIKRLTAEMDRQAAKATSGGVDLGDWSRL